MSAEQKAPHPEKIDEIADTVTAARIRLGLTQAAFAQLLETPLGTIRGWEQGRRKPPPCAILLMRVAVEQPEAVMAVSGSDFKPTAAPKKGTRKRIVGKGAAQVSPAADLHEPGEDADFWLL